jgi:DNA invertase Pin-like site-specific DNA recombinase
MPGRVDPRPLGVPDRGDTVAGSITSREKVRAALYARVSCLDQQPENQLADLRRYATARGWEAVEYIDHGVSGARERRPALDRLLTDGRKRRFDVLVVWRLDRLGRNLRHLVMTLEELQHLGIGFVSLNEGIDALTPAGRLQMHILAAIAEFERARIVERVRAGLARAKAKGKRLGRRPYAILDERFEAVAHLPLRKAAAELGVSKGVVQRWRVGHKPLCTSSTFASNQA